MHTYILKYMLLTLHHIINNFQLTGLACLIAGSILLDEAVKTSSGLHEYSNGMCNFLYQWRNNKVPVASWRNLREEGHKHLSFLTWTQDDSQRSDSSKTVVLPRNRLCPLRGGLCGLHSQLGHVAEGKTPYYCYKSNRVLLLFQPVA
jgi:hypothetical protein